MKVLFLDVDGPLIPERMHLKYANGLYGYDRQDGIFVWDKEFIKELNEHCPPQDIKIVFNSAHNSSGPSIMKFTSKFNGLNQELLHNDCCTRFPDHVDFRIDGIIDWLHRNAVEPIKWLVVDDFDMKIPNQILVDLKQGVTAHHIIEIFGTFMYNDNQNLIYTKEKE